MTEEQIIQSQKKGKLFTYNNIPHSIISMDLQGTEKTKYLDELKEIAGYYEVYEDGADFTVDPTSGKPSNLKWKKSREIINSEARFMFSQPIEITVNSIGNEKKKNVESDSAANEMLKKILEKTMFNTKIIKAAKDCFIGKRVCCIVNFSEEKGITINFLNAMQFYYEMSGDDLTRLVTYTYLNSDTVKTEQRILRKSYDMESGKCLIKQIVYDGAGTVIEEEEEIKTDFEYIPAVVIFNDGLSADIDGESEVETQQEFEKYYSEYSNDDMNAEKKSMNPIKYTIGASVESTENLPLGPGAFWDLQPNEDGVNTYSCMAGLIESNMSYSSALKTTLDRIESAAYSQASVPNINNERLQGMITSGKTLGALYWPLTVRSNERMLVWADALKFIVQVIFDGIGFYPFTIGEYTDKRVESKMYAISIVSNYALPSDESEEKQNDLAEVNAQTMSRKAYMVKWRQLSPDDADAELKQILLEKQMFEESYVPPVDFSKDMNISKDDDTKSKLDGTGDLQDISEEEQL